METPKVKTLVFKASETYQAKLAKISEYVHVNHSMPKNKSSAIRFAIDCLYKKIEQGEVE